ncbi:S-layer homology domain-containing protein [Paenibacillus brevis]|uniref:S-layer homology domain-containing protein n=1 Tax=Paenibacillus brevis TaxID=2841508 RepID=A0ABS6FVZ7_9BACL|nr:S-layer homology domain-containing protein [Paenibacillus brevis]MBU5674408.1 S-layer homology domain-containing protein [Paenibacillus brevis]
MSSYKRTFKRSTKRAVSTMLVTAMCLSGGAAVFAEEAQSTAVTTSTASVLLFSDVSDGFWAEKHIYKLAAEGIILGDAGKFRPSDSVTQQEAITMAVRFMNLESKLGSGSGAPEEMKVGAYFKPYLELALSEKLIDKTEELGATGASESWGAKTASREWIAKLLVRALGQEEKAKSAASATTGFADHTSISPAARGYVNVAVQLELTKGVEGNRFDPLGKVTRAQLATFFSRGSEYVTPGYSNVYEGIVTELTDSKLTLFTNGQLKSFTLDSRSFYFTKDSEAKSSRNAIQLYTKVLAVDKVGSAAYVEVRDASQQLEKTEGTLLKKLSDNRLLMLVNNDSVTYTYDGSTSFLDQNGNAISVDSLTEDSTIIVQRETFTSAKKPVIVQVKSGVVNKSGTGTVDLVSVADKTIRIKDDATGAIETYKYDDTSILIYQNQLLGGAAELQAGAAVTYTVKNSIFTRLEVTKAMERTVKGTLLSVEGSTLLSFTNSAGKAEIKALAAKPVIVINGIADATLEDLIADVKGGDQVELTISPDEQVTKIVVTGRQSELLTDLSVVNYEPKYKALMVVDSANKVHAFTVDDKTKAEYNSTTPTLTGVESLLTKGRKINVTHIGDRVLAIQVVYKYEGTYVSTDTAAKKVSILLPGGQTVAVPYQGTAPSIELYGKTSATIADLKAGDPVTVMLSANQDTLQTLAVRKTVQFEISSVNTSNSRIQASSNGVTDNFYVDKATLLNDTGAAITVSSLQAGQTVNVTFNGRTAASLQVVKLTLGKVTAIDASSVTVKSFSGTPEVYSIGNGVKVVRGTSVTSGTATLTTSDHVELRKDVDGTLLIKVLNSLERKFQRYDSINNDILVYRSTIQDDNYRFGVTSNLYIHQGDTTLTVQSLKDNDKIVLYFNGDKLVEVEKQ